MIPSASGPPQKTHGEPAPKRVTKEFFKDLLAGGIAGADTPCLLEAADEEALHRLIPLTCTPFASRKGIGGVTRAQSYPACVSSSCTWAACTCRWSHAAGEHGHTIYMHAMGNSAVQCSKRI